MGWIHRVIWIVVDGFCLVVAMVDSLRNPNSTLACFARRQKTSYVPVSIPSPFQFAAFAIGRDDGCASAEVDLGFFAGSAFHPSEWDGASGSQLANESLDRLAASFEFVIGLEILPDSLTRQASIKGSFDDLFVRLALALPPGRPGDRNGWF